MGFSGNKFTWDNKKEGDERIRERLDRGLCTTTWRAKFQNADIFHEQIIGSDHAPLRLMLHRSNPISRSRAPFRFDQRWIEDGKCGEIIKQGWEGRGDCQNKLQNLTTMINMRGKRKWQNSGQKIKETKRRLGEVQNGYRDAYSAEMEKRLEGELGRLWRQEELYWKQRAGIRWLKEGDKNMKFFHASTIQRRQKNRILKLKTDDLLWIEEEEEIARHMGWLLKWSLNFAQITRWSLNFKKFLSTHTTLTDYPNSHCRLRTSNFPSICIRGGAIKAATSSTLPHHLNQTQNPKPKHSP
ncbi:hypothetical protein LINPERPRIM_LOCUS6851 [Linum perenne]